MGTKMHFGSLYSDDHLPINKIHKYSINQEVAKSLISEELELESNEKQNLATFCQTYMESEADDLIKMCLSKNAIDKTEYPKVTEIEQRCLKIIEQLWHGENTIGSSTIGSSEGCILGGLNMKMRYQKAHPNNNHKLNLIISSAYQVCWEKFATYFDVELKTIPITENSYTLDVNAVMDAIDEYTIGIVGILGVTYTGMYDNIEELDKKLEQYNKVANYPLYIHVDAASGGLYAPFVETEICWDFKLKNVVSINTSGHKYGLTYPGVGWILFKDESYVMEELLFDVAYLGGSVSTMGINFSHSASHIVAQYYNFTRFGYEGYRKIHLKTHDIAKYIMTELKKLDRFEFINDGSELPILCFKLNQDYDWNLYALSEEVLKNGWQIPSYELSPNLTNETIARIVVRADLSYGLADSLINDIKKAVEHLELNPIKGANNKHFTH